MNLLNKLLDFIARKTLRDPFYQSLRKLQTSVKDINQFEKEILNNLLGFVNKSVKDIIIPRADICAVSIDANLDEIYNVISSKGHTRTIVYKESLDEIVGFIHIKDLYFTAIDKKKFNLRNIIRKPINIVGSMSLIDLLKNMQQQRTHIACVVDEYGDTEGIVTLEDVISEIVGPMNDEHEILHPRQTNYEVINKNTIIVNAHMDIEDLEKILNITLKEEKDEFDTINGLILAKLGTMPNIKDIIYITDNLKAEIVAKDLRMIKKIKITNLTNEFKLK